MRKALLVGIDNYPGTPLTGCVADARYMAEILSTDYDGSGNFDCRLLISTEKEVRKDTLLGHIEKLFADKADVALLHFSGHGTVNNLGGVLVTPDATKYSQGVAMQDVLTIANASPVKEVVILLDCCHSGAMGQVPAIDNDKALLREGVSILTASRESQVSVETGGHGLMTFIVGDALMGGAADVRGNVSIASIYAYVDQRLGPWDQRPLFKSHVSTLIPLRRCAPRVDLEILRELPRWFVNATDEFALDPSFEPTLEPRHVENERAFKKLQKLRAAGLLMPVGEEHMYDAALNRKGCALTAEGRHYWHLAKARRI